MTPLQEHIRRLPPGVEFLVVICVAFGRRIFSSILALGVGTDAAAGTSGVYVLSDAALIGKLVYELAMAAFLVWFLHQRGWTLEKVGLRVTWRGTGLGWLLLVATWVVAMIVQSVGENLLPARMHGIGPYPTADPHVSMQIVFVAATVNGIFEELFVAGYIITALREVRGVWTAINVSTVMRLLYHMYQGPIGVLTIVPMGLMFGYLYARTRQLWPLIFAHVLIDIIGLSALGRLLEGF